MSDLSAAHRAVFVASAHTGGCSACAQSLAALEAPRYAKRLNALGVTFARALRHADVILLCGALTEQARASIGALLDGAPHPRALVAVGDCAINGCVFAGSPCLTTPLAQVFNANVVIGGCPPAPLAIIEAIAEAQRLLSGHPVATDVASAAARTAAPAGGEAPDARDALETAAVAPLAISIESPALTAPATPAPDRAARLAALIEAAREGWGDDDSIDDDTDDDTDDDIDDLAHGHMLGQAMTDHNYLLDMGNGASVPGVHHHKEKRR
ncbi:MAG TPA: hypothetical protein VE338_20400 [Ktedonobacterales bacterium]|jgi:Ni,Fe-hydrogenase III small subunit|nr:hypothetical protein [Ktedonobacterales bacterium]